MKLSGKPTHIGALECSISTGVAMSANWLFIYTLGSPRVSFQYPEPYPDPLRQLGGHQRMGLLDVGEEIGVL